MSLSTQFTNASEESGLAIETRTWGAAWSDLNGDRLPDLYVSNHQTPASVFINRGDGTFEEKVDALPDILSDTHGAITADFDNDGDQDIAQVTGGTGPNRNQLLINDGTGQFEDQAQEFGVRYPLQRGRTPLWFDLENDGDLDLAVLGRPESAGVGEVTIFRQESDQFIDIGNDVGLTVDSSPFATLTDTNGDQQLELVIINSSRPWINVYETGERLTEINDQLRNNGLFPSARDLAIADFNGDLRMDWYLARTRSFSNQSEASITDGTLYAALANNGKDIGVEFEGTLIDLELFIEAPYQPDEVFIGAQSLSSDEFGIVDITPDIQGIARVEYALSLDSNDLSTHGINPSKDGFHIGFNPETNRWESRLVGQGREIILRADSVAPITDLDRIGFENSPPERDDRLLLNTENGFIDATDQSNINEILLSSRSVAAGDFDNDMDVDIFVGTGTRTQNTENILFENNGEGVFTRVQSSVFSTTSGLLDTITTVDYDQNGFLDLFVTNGQWPPPRTNEGVHQLLANGGNENNWIQFDLVGVISSRDAIGATVYVTTPDGKTQIREQNGGVHLFSQNHSRIHFGLGENTQVDEVEIVWPTGDRQIIENVQANQILEITEGIDPTPAPGPAPSSPITITTEFYDGPTSITFDRDTTLKLISTDLNRPVIEGIDGFQNGLVLEGSAGETYSVDIDRAAPTLYSTDFTSQAEAWILPDDFESDSITNTGLRTTINPPPGIEFQLIASDVNGNSFDPDPYFGLLTNNPDALDLPAPNAFQVDLPSPNGRPTYDSQTDTGAFIWYNEQADLWQLRASAGGQNNRFIGSIKTNGSIRWSRGLLLESNDIVLTQSDQINFNLWVSGAGQDGIGFRLSPDSSLEFTVNNQDVFIGGDGTPTISNSISIL